MSKKNFNNLIFVVFLVFMVFISGIFLALSLRLFSLESLFFQANYLIYSHLLNQAILGLIGVTLLFLAVYLIWQKNHLDKGDLFIVQKNSFGEIKISIGSITYLVLKVMKGIGEIVEAKPEINILRSGGINASLHLSVKQDVYIPELSERIQRTLKEYLLETGGIEAKEIKIHIEKIFYDDKKIV